VSDRPTPRSVSPELGGSRGGVPWATIALVALPLLLLLASPALASLYTDLRWFRSLGQEPVFTTLLGTQLGLGVAVGVLAFAALFANVRITARASRGLGGLVLADAEGGDE